jgi:hypothetical protein
LWSGYLEHFADEEKPKQHAFYMGAITALAAEDHELLWDFAREIDRYLEQYGCRCEACRNKPPLAQMLVERRIGNNNGRDFDA